MLRKFGRPWDSASHLTGVVSPLLQLLMAGPCQQCPLFDKLRH